MAEDIMTNYGSFDLDKSLEAAGYKFEFEYGDYDYDWHVTRVYTRDGKVFDLSDGGCSCNSWGESWDTSDEAIGDMQEVTRAPSVESIILDACCSSGHGDDREKVVNQYRELGLR